MKKYVLTLLLSLVATIALAQSPRIQAPLTSDSCPGTGCVTLSVQGLGAASVQVTGTFVGTLEFETSLDGVTYTSWTVAPAGGGAGVTSATAPDIWQGSIGGLGILRTRFSAYTSGTATVTMQAADNGTNLLTQSNTWTGTQTFDDVTITGTFALPGVLELGAFAFADLPASPSAGTLAYVTDSNTVTWGATIAGSSTNKVLAFFNGTNWTVAGK